MNQSTVAPTPPSPDRVISVLEAMSIELCDESPWTTKEDLQRLARNVYVFCHIAGNPSCIKSHGPWIAEFEATEESMRTAGLLPTLSQSQLERVAAIVEEGEEAE